MKLEEVLDHIPKGELERLSRAYNVDHQVKKLHGQTMFQLLLFSMLNIKNNSLRVMEEFYHSLAFKSIANISYQGVRYNSIRERPVNINADYFEAIFNSCLKKYQGKYLKKKHNIISFDFTLVRISSKLLEEGMPINKKGDKRFIKFSIGFSNIPIHSRLFTEQSFVSEDFTLKELIKEYPLNAGNILFFDGGLQARATFEEFNDDNVSFVTRLNDYTRFEAVKEFEITEDHTERLLLEQDLEVKLYDRRNKKTQKFLRLIIAKEKQNGEVFYFLTNSRTLSAKVLKRFTNNDGKLRSFFDS